MTTFVPTNPIMMSNQTPPQKRRRGRPPKMTTLTNRITTTLLTSPINSSPAADNSAAMARLGAPDIFTPLMRVSPNKNSANYNSPRNKKRRADSHNQAQTQLKTPKLDRYSTPIKRSLHSSSSSSMLPPASVSSKTQANMASITKNLPIALNTPPTRFSKQYLNPNVLLSSPIANLSSSANAMNHITTSAISPLTPASNFGSVGFSSPLYTGYYQSNIGQESLDVENDASVAMMNIKMKSEKSMSEQPMKAEKSPLLPSVLLEEKKDFRMSLVVDDQGKAVLSNFASTRFAAPPPSSSTNEEDRMETRRDGPLLQHPHIAQHPQMAQPLQMLQPLQMVQPLQMIQPLQLAQPPQLAPPHIVQHQHLQPQPHIQPQSLQPQNLQPQHLQPQHVQPQHVQQPPPSLHFKSKSTMNFHAQPLEEEKPSIRRHNSEIVTTTTNYDMNFNFEDQLPSTPKQRSSNMANFNSFFPTGNSPLNFQLTPQQQQHFLNFQTPTTNRLLNQDIFLNLNSTPTFINNILNVANKDFAKDFIPTNLDFSEEMDDDNCDARSALRQAMKMKSISN